MGSILIRKISDACVLESEVLVRKFVQVLFLVTVVSDESFVTILSVNAESWN